MALAGEDDSPNVTTPKEGIEYANKRIKKLEKMSEEAQKNGDLASASRCEGHIVKWSSILQFYIRQDYQMSGGGGDASKGISESISKRNAKKQRFNSS